MPELETRNAFRMRVYASGDEVVINQHFNSVFDQQRPLTDWHHKFQPEKDGCSILVAVNTQDEIIAQYAVVHSTMQMDGNVFRAGQPVDVFCLRQDGATQRRVYSKLVLQFFDTFGKPDDLPLLYGFPGYRHIRLGQLKLGYGESVPVGFWQKNVDRRRLVMRQRPPIDAPDPDAIDRLWDRASKRYPVSIVRDADWLDRRYRKPTTTPYIHLWINEGERLSSWAVLRIENNVAHWVDLVWDGQDSGALKELERQCLETARLTGVRRMEMWLSGDEEAESIFSSVGWHRQEHPLNLQLVARSFDPRIDAPNLIERLYLTMGNSDLI